jgi:hypothetical protein
VLRPGGRLILIQVRDRSTRRELERPDYAPITSALPLLYSTAADVTPLVEATGLAELGVELLTDEALWGEPPENARYALSARKPG